MCIDAVKRDARMLKYVPDRFKTQEMCKNAVEDDSDMFEYVPDVFKTEKST